jgi:hypothetical protein
MADIMADDLGDARPRGRQRLSLHGRQIANLPIRKNPRIDLRQRIKRGEKSGAQPLWTRTSRKRQANRVIESERVHLCLPGRGLKLIRMFGDHRSEKHK